jgi:predicted MFS family arabinose efflux permease
MTTQVQQAEQAVQPVPRTGVSNRWPITAVFFLNGLTLCSYIVRIPAIKAGQQLSNGELGLVGMLFGVAALVAMQCVGALAARVSMTWVIRVALVVMPLVLVLSGLRQGVVVFAVAVAALGAVHGTLDVAMNAQAVDVETASGRPVLSGCHAAWSISAVVASLIGAGMVAGGVAPAANFVLIAVLVFVSGLVVGPRLLSTDSRQPTAKRARVGWRTGWTRTVVSLGLIGFALMLCEGAALAWSAIFLHDSRGASLAMAATAVTAYTAFQTIGRLGGDRLKVRYGARTMFRIGGLVAVAGFAIAVLSPAPAVAVAGFAIFGFGGSSLIPMTFSAVGHAGGEGPAAAIFVSRFTTFTYSGILLGPALIGTAAQLVGLPWTLAALLPALALVAIAGRLPDAH